MTSVSLDTVGNTFLHDFLTSDGGSIVILAVLDLRPLPLGFGVRLDVEFSEHDEEDEGVGADPVGEKLRVGAVPHEQQLRRVNQNQNELRLQRTSTLSVLCRATCFGSLFEGGMVEVMRCVRTHLGPEKTTGIQNRL